MFSLSPDLGPLHFTWLRVISHLILLTGILEFHLTFSVEGKLQVLFRHGGWRKHGLGSEKQNKCGQWKSSEWSSGIGIFRVWSVIAGRPTGQLFT